MTKATVYRMADGKLIENEAMAIDYDAALIIRNIIHPTFKSSVGESINAMQASRHLIMEIDRVINILQSFRAKKNRLKKSIELQKTNAEKLVEVA